MTKNWAKQYATQTNLTDRVRGRRPAPEGVERLKVGRVPTINNLTYSGQKHSLQTILARFNPPGGEYVPTGDPVNIRCFVYSPTNRFRGEVRVVFEPDDVNTLDPAFNIVPQWSIRTMSRNPLTGREVPQQLAYPSPALVTTDLPDGYEFDSACQLLRVDVTLFDTQFLASYLPQDKSCNVKLIVTWEPNVEYNPDDAEKNRLFSLCSISPVPTVQIANASV